MDMSNLPAEGQDPGAESAGGSQAGEPGRPTEPGADTGPQQAAWQQGPADDELPETPGSQLPETPGYDMPMPGAPSYELPSMPGYELPSMPGYELPSMPGYELPSGPGYGLPSEVSPVEVLSGGPGTRDASAPGRREYAPWISAGAGVVTVILVVVALILAHNARPPHLVFPAPATAGGLTQDRQAENDINFKEVASSVRQRLSSTTHGHVKTAVVAVYDVPASTSIGGGPIRVIFVGGSGTVDEQSVMKDATAEMGASGQRVPTGPGGGSAECGNINQVSICAWATVGTFGVLYAAIVDENPAALGSLLVKMRPDLETK